MLVHDQTEFVVVFAQLELFILRVIAAALQCASSYHLDGDTAVGVVLRAHRITRRDLVKHLRAELTTASGELKRAHLCLLTAPLETEVFATDSTLSWHPFPELVLDVGAKKLRASTLLEDSLPGLFVLVGAHVPRPSLPLCRVVLQQIELP